MLKQAFRSVVLENPSLLPNIPAIPSVSALSVDSVVSVDSFVIFKSAFIFQLSAFRARARAHPRASIIYICVLGDSILIPLSSVPIVHCEL